MLSQQARRDRLNLQSGDLDSLVTGLLTGQYGDVPAGEVERVGEKRQQGVIRGPVDRWRRKPDEKRTSPHPIDRAQSRSRDDADIDDGRHAGRLPAAI
jgi:hypothetical protein